MITKYIMSASAISLGLIGVVLSFFPQEISLELGLGDSMLIILILKILSAFYLGFAILNWISKDSIIGGIYGRPITFGNLLHYGVVTLSLVKIVFSIETNVFILAVLTIYYTLFAFGFAYIFTTTPSQVK